MGNSGPDQQGSEPVAGTETAWDTAVSPDSRSHFRPDIEGMRAVAILAVLAYHAGLPYVTGGFVGVDIFFVISGFLITGLLLREYAAGRIDLPGFYARRARRLLPAALAVIAITVAAAYFIVNQLDFPAVAADGAAAALYVSNYRFALNAIDYFAVGVPSPLLHYWSLGVEEQFYLFWPLLMLIGARVLGVRRLWWLVALIGVTSFILSVYITNIEPPWAFYSLPTRAWQLALGGLIALEVLALPKGFGRHVHSLVGAAGIALIGIAMFAISDATLYPGLAAGLPAAGAALLIVAGERRDSVVSRLLATPPMRYLGRISYSLYLWHWPILILGLQVIGNQDLSVRLVLAAASIVAADLSTRFIEAPFRAGGRLRISTPRALAAAGSASFVVALSAILASGFLLASGYTGPPPISVPPSGVSPGPMVRQPALPVPQLTGPLPADVRPPLATARQDLPQEAKDHCDVAPADTQLKVCFYGDLSSATTIALVGDSHAGQWMPAMALIAEQLHWQLAVMIKSSCPPFDVVIREPTLKRAYTECTTWRQQAFAWVEGHHPLVVLASATHGWDIYDDQGLEHSFGQADQIWQQGMVTALSRLRAATTHTVLVADTPHYGGDPLACLAGHPLIETCTKSRAAMTDPGYLTIEQSAANSALVGLIDSTNWLCTPDQCPLVMDNILVWRDTGHMTATMSARLAPLFSWALGQVGVEVDQAEAPTP